MPAEVKLRGAMADNSFKLGLSTKVWGKNNGPCAERAHSRPPPLTTPPTPSRRAANACAPAAT
eukprot:2769386-Prymnesium_polylepis.1